MLTDLDSDFMVYKTSWCLVCDGYIFRENFCPVYNKDRGGVFFGHIANYVPGCTMSHDSEDHIMCLYHHTKLESYMHLKI
jgi:hypothetical protein